MEERREFKIINEEDMINEDSQTSRKNMDRITQGFLFDQKQKALKVNKDMNKEDVTHMNQLIVSMRKRLKPEKKEQAHVQKKANMDLQIHPIQQSLNHILSASNLATVDVSSVEDEDKCQECVNDKIVVRKQNQDIVEFEASKNQNLDSHVQQNELRLAKDHMSIENGNDKYHEKQDTQEKSINTSKSNASITYNDNYFHDVYDQKSFHNKDKMIHIHRPYQLSLQKSSLKNKNQSEKNSKINSPTYEKKNAKNGHLSISQPKQKFENNERNQQSKKLTNNLSYKNILGSDSRNYQTLNPKYNGMRQKSDDSIKLTAGKKSYVSKQQLDKDSNKNQNVSFKIKKDSTLIVNPNLDVDMEIVQQHKKMFQNTKIQNSSQSLGRISIADLKQNLRKIRMKNSQLNNYEQINDFDRRNSIL